MERTEESIADVSSKLSDVIRATEEAAATVTTREVESPTQPERIFKRERREEAPQKPRWKRRTKIAIAASTLMLLLFVGWMMTGRSEPRQIAKLEPESYETFLARLSEPPREERHVLRKYEGHVLKPVEEPGFFHSFVDRAFKLIQQNNN